MSAEPDPTVAEAFECEIGPFVAAIRDARDAMLETADAAEKLQAKIDALHGRTGDNGDVIWDTGSDWFRITGGRGPELPNFSGGEVVLPNPDVRRFLDTDGPDE